MTAQQQYELLHKELNEQQWCLYLGTAALKNCKSQSSRTARRIRQASSSPTPNSRPSLSCANSFMESGTLSSNLKPLPHSRTKPRHMVDTGIHLRRSHQESKRWLLQRRRLPLVGRRRVHRLAGRTLETPGVTLTLRVRAAREIGCIDLAGLDWCDVGAVVELPLDGAERRRVVEGERERRGPLGLRRRYRFAAPS